MKDLLIFYFQILLPIPPIIFIGLKKDNPELFVGLLLFYMIYRIFTDFFRLLNKKVVEKKDFIYFLIPFYRTRYFKELYFI